MVLMTKNWKKNYSWKFFFIFFLSKTAIYLSLGLHKVCLSYRRSLQFSKEAIQHFKTWTFTNYFLLLWVILPSWIRIRIPNTDPDPQIRLNTDPIRIRIHNPAFPFFNDFAEAIPGSSWNYFFLHGCFRAWGAAAMGGEPLGPASTARLSAPSTGTSKIL